MNFSSYVLIFRVYNAFLISVMHNNSHAYPFTNFLWSATLNGKPLKPLSSLLMVNGQCLHTHNAMRFREVMLKIITVLRLPKKNIFNKTNNYYRRNLISLSDRYARICKIPKFIAKLKICRRHSLLEQSYRVFTRLHEARFSCLGSFGAATPYLQEGFGIY